MSLERLRGKETSGLRSPLGENRGRFEDEAFAHLYTIHAA